MAVGDPALPGADPSRNRRHVRRHRAWFANLVTGRCPHGLFDFVEGVIRYDTRVVGYAFVLVTDEYPPFHLGA
jgi:Domain of unknown function (DUF4389)